MKKDHSLSLHYGFQSSRKHDFNSYCFVSGNSARQIWGILSIVSQQIVVAWENDMVAIFDELFLLFKA
ncbi:MAG: hypothetical protein IKT52_02355 [Oscillospiraceae bacterium]|nr:hypothetical protein [Oscillospiraceae bacterium]